MSINRNIATTLLDYINESNTTTKLTLYHGSFSKFDTFDMTKVKKGGGQTTYGVGIYATDNIGYAKSYVSGENGISENNDSGYLYTLEINNPNFLDFGKIVNNKVSHNIIDSDNLKRIRNKIEASGKKLDISDTDIVWSVYKKIVDMYASDFTMKQKFNYPDFYSKKEASEFLYDIGIDGLRYPLDSSFKISTSYGYSGYGYVIYNPKTITNIERVSISKS